MSNLLRAEFLRLVSRRFTWALLLAVVAMAAFVSLTTSESIRPVNVNDPVAIKSYEESLRAYDQDLKNCGEPVERCSLVKPTLNDYLRTPADYATYVQGSALSVGILMLIGIAVLAASMVGAEYASGSLATQLTFTPQRLRVMAAKLVAATVGALGIAIAFIIASVVVSTITFLTLRGAGEVHADVGLPILLGRLLVLAILISALASALTMAVGSSYVTIGVMGVVMIGSLILSPYITRPTPLLQVLPSNLMGALLTGDFSVWSIDQPNTLLSTITYQWSLVFSVVAVALVISVSAVAFRRRDILR